MQVYLGSIYHIITYTKDLLQYTNDILSNMEVMASNLGEMGGQCVEIVRQSEQFVEYRNDVYRILGVVRRVGDLEELCSG